MFCRILLLVGVASCVHGMLEPHHVALRYRAEEGGNITVEWSFSSGADIPVSSLKIHCVSVWKLKVFFHQDRSVDESLHEQFAGRVQCDQDALRTGRVRLHLSRARTDDSGQYLCRMATGSGRKVKLFSLHVTAVNKSDPVATTAAPVTAPAAAESRGRGCLYAALGLTAAAALAACYRVVSPAALRGKPEHQERGGVQRRVDMTSLLP